MSEKKDTMKYIGKLQRRGYKVTLSGSNHLLAWRGGQLVTSVAGSPNGGQRGLKNLRATIARFERGTA